MIIGFDDFELDVARLELRRGGAPVKADMLVLRLLACLVRRAGQLVTKEELVREVWDGRAVADNVITVSMARLRKTLGHRRGVREYVVNIYGRGYRFIRPTTTRQAATGRPSNVVSRPDAPPFVGRARALERIRHTWREACSGRGRLCVLMGEPGIGKTALVEALERELAAPQVRVAWGYCREAGDTPPLWPWLRLLRILTTSNGADAQSRDTESAPDVDRLLGLQGTETQDTEHLGASGAARHRAFEAILETLSRAAKEQPCLLVLDDLHRADAASLELLSQLLDEIAHTAILVVATLRHTSSGRAPRPDTHLPQILGHRNCERIQLDRLQEAEVAAYVAALLDDPDGALGRAVFRKSEGNPFFMVELSRQLEQPPRPDLEALEVPQAALDLVRQRVARLDEDALGVLSVAAVIGRSFELGLLQAVTGRDAPALMASLDDALAAEVVVAAPESTTAFAFGHELLRHVLYDALPAAERRRWHAAIAYALDQRVKANESVAPSELAYHLHAALPDADLRMTVHYCREAARAASAVFANPDVVRYTRQALEALSLMEQPSIRLRMSLLYIMAIHARGHTATVYEQAIGAVVRLAREHQDGRMLVRGAFMLNLHPGLQPLPGLGPALEQALDLLEPDDVAYRAAALAGLACAPPHCYSAASAHALLEKAVPLARQSGSRVTRYSTYLCKLYVEGGPAHAEAAQRMFEELDVLAQQNPDRVPVLPGDLAMHRAVTALQQGDVETMRAAIERLELRSLKLNHGELLWHSRRFRALASIQSGAIQDGLSLLETLHAQARQQPAFGTEVFATFDRVVVLGELGRPLELDHLDAVLAPEPSEPPVIWSIKLRALTAAGHHDRARVLLGAVPPGQLADLPCDRDYLGTLGHVVRASLALDALEHAEAAYALLSRYPQHFAGHVAFWNEGAAPQLLGMIAQRLGRTREAVEHLEAGLRMNEAAGLALRVEETRAALERLS